MASRMRLPRSFGGPRHKRRASLSFLMEALESRLLLSVNPESIPLTLSPLTAAATSASIAQAESEYQKLESQLAHPAPGAASLGLSLGQKSTRPGATTPAAGSTKSTSATLLEPKPTLIPARAPFAGPGYDEVMGLGSPKAHTLLTDPTANVTATQISIATEPPATVIPGAEFGTIVQATDSLGHVDVSVNGTVELAGTGGSTYDATMTDGQAVFDTLSLSALGTYHYTATLESSSLTPGTSTDVTVVTPTPGVNYYFPLPIYGTPDGPGDLYDAVNASNLAGGTNVVELSQSTIPYDVSHGELYVANLSGLSDYQLTIYGDVNPALSVISASFANRVLEINGNSNTTVTLQSLTIAQGDATDPMGGGILIDGGNVALTGVAVSNNEAVGTAGSSGSPGGVFVGNGSQSGSRPTHGLSGGPGGPGGNAYGGGIYMGGGTLTLTGDTISDNLAQGGAGGHGGTGGPGFGLTVVHLHTSSGTITAYELFPMETGGSGGPGGAGGVGQGGGIYVGGGQLSITDTTLDGNTAQGGAGGTGGTGGFALTGSQHKGGNGGNGGPGGSGGGGAIFIASGNNVSLVFDNLTNNLAVGGVGGHGGLGRTGAFGYSGSFGGFAAGTTGDGRGNAGANGGNGSSGGPGGNGGYGGTGGNGGGGGIYVSVGSFSISGGGFLANTAQGGAGGAGGTAGHGGPGGAGGTGGFGATGFQGSMFTGVRGGTGGTGGNGGNGGAGGAAGFAGGGGAGGSGQGGGIFIGGTNATGTTSGQLHISYNAAIGGAGGAGGYGNVGGTGGGGGFGGGGGAGGDGGAATVFFPGGGSGGMGGQGGNGGFAGTGGAANAGGPGGQGGAGQGGGAYVFDGSLTLYSTVFSYNIAAGGAGGMGGHGGQGGFVNPAGAGGTGGMGGFGGDGFNAHGTTEGFFTTTSNGGTTFVTTGYVLSGGNGGNGGMGGRGGNGANQIAGPPGGAGGPGGFGGTGAGGGVFVSFGTVTLVNNTISWNAAIGGAGGQGGVGGHGGDVYNGGFAGFGGGGGGGGSGGGAWFHRSGHLFYVGSPGNGGNGATGGTGGTGGDGGSGGNGGSGGTGGFGGYGAGGGAYVEFGSLSLTNSTVAYNEAVGGTGGHGGPGGSGGTALSGGPGGPGGAGGNGGDAGFVKISNNAYAFVIAGAGGNGGRGGQDGNGGSFGGSGGGGGNGGNGGYGGTGAGGGLYIFGGTLTLNADTVAYNAALGGSGGIGGNGGAGGVGFYAGPGGYGFSGTTTFGSREVIRFNNGGNGGGLPSGASASSISNFAPGLGGTGGNGGHGGSFGGNGGGGGNGGNGGGGGNAYGGGTYVSFGTLTVYNSTIANNFVGVGFGGGIGGGGAGGGVVKTIQQVHPSVVTAPGGFGGYSYYGAQAPDGISGTPAVPGTVGSPGNSGTRYGSSGTSAAGGGLYVTYGSTVSLYNATIAFNATEFGGVGQGVMQVGGAVNMYNSLFGDNGYTGSGSTGTSLAGRDYYNNSGAGGTPVAYNSLFGSAPVGVAQGGGSLVGNPGLDPTGLQWNGGPTQTIAIVDGSAYSAYGGDDGVAGSSYLFVDQRGYAPAPGNWSIGAYQYNGAPVAAPTATLISAPNVSPQQYGETSYTFTVEYYAQAGLYQSSIAGATVTVTPPGSVGGPIAATLSTITPVGPSNAFGAYQEFTVVYTITPPGGSWTSADNGTYTISLASTISDTQGNSVGPETLGTFLVQTAKIGITKFTLLRNRQTGLWQGTITLTNNGDSPFIGPIFVLFNLPAGVILTNATGTYDGQPYLEVSVPGGTLAAGGSVNVVVSFNSDLNPMLYSTTYYIVSLGS
jgi:hypothetical protein